MRERGGCASVSYSCKCINKGGKEKNEEHSKLI